MGWKNPLISWVILAVGLALTAYLLVLAAAHLGAVYEERKRADHGYADPMQTGGNFI